MHGTANWEGLLALWWIGSFAYAFLAKPRDSEPNTPTGGPEGLSAGLKAIGLGVAGTIAIVILIRAFD